MKRTFTIITPVALAVGLLAPIGAAQTTPKPVEARPATSQDLVTSANVRLSEVPARASKIIGTEIVDAAGKRIAEIKDLVVIDSGNVVAIVERMDEMLTAVPLGNLEARMSKSDLPVARAKERSEREASGETPQVRQFVMASGATLLDAAPSVSDADLVDSAWLTSATGYFARQPISAAKDGKDGTDSSKPKRDGDAAMHMDDHAMAMKAVTKHAFVKALIGQDVKTTGGDTLGDIEDVAVDLGRGRVAYAIVSVGGILGVGDTLHAIAFEGMTMHADWVSIAMTKTGLTDLAKVDLDRLPANPTLSLSKRDDGAPASVPGRKSD